MQIRRTSSRQIDRAMSIADRIAVGMAYVIVALSVGLAAMIVAIHNFTTFVRF